MSGFILRDLYLTLQLLRLLIRMRMPTATPMHMLTPCCLQEGQQLMKYHSTALLLLQLHLDLHTFKTQPWHK